MNFKIGDEVKVSPKDSTLVWYGRILRVYRKTALVDLGAYGITKVNIKDLN